MSDLEEAFAFQLRAAGVAPFEREQCFHPTRRWRFDFSWPAAKVAVELDGATWSGGRHTRGAGYAQDCRKLAEAACLGWRVMRFPREMVDDLSALGYVERALAWVTAHPVQPEAVEGR